MRRKTLLFFLMAVLLIFSVRAADTVNIHLDEMGMSIDVPSDCSIFTRNMSPDDPMLAEKGIDSTQLQQLMEERSIYLDLLNEDPAFEILVTMQANVVQDMTVFNEEELEALKEPLAQEYELNGMSVTSVERFTTDQTVFFRTEGDISGTQAVIYYTIFDHQAISIVLRYTGDSMPEEYRTQIQQMVDSVRFDGAATAQSDDVSGMETEEDVESAVEAGAEEAAEEIEAAVEELEESASQTETLISPSEQLNTEDVSESSAPAKKKGFPVLPVALGGAAIGAIAGFAVARGKKKRDQMPTYTAPASPAAPAATVPPVSGAAAVAGATVPYAQSANPVAPVASEAAAPVTPAVPSVPAVPAAPVMPAAPEKRVCSACGADLSPTDTVCPYCGTKAD